MLTQRIRTPYSAVHVLGLSFGGAFGWELVVGKQHLPCSVGIQCTLGGSLQVLKKNILLWIIEGQTRSCILSGAKQTLSLELNKLK